MANLPQYAQKAFKSGRQFVTSLDNPRRRVTQKDRCFRLAHKGYDVDAGDFDQDGNLILGTPYIYEIEELEIINLEEVVTGTFEFNTVE